MTRAQEIFDGVMLSDGGLRMNGRQARLTVVQSGPEHIDWLHYIKDNCLKPLGLQALSGYPKTLKMEYHGMQQDYSLLVTKTSSFLTTQYRLWYPADGSRRVPSGLKLNPVTIANWFTGDGYSSYHSNSVGSVYAVFTSYKFPISDLQFLAGQLRVLGVNASVHKNGISTSDKLSVNTLIGIVEPHIVGSYRYKLKWATITPPEVVALRRKIGLLTRQRNSLARSASGTHH